MASNGSNDTYHITHIVDPNNIFVLREDAYQALIRLENGWYQLAQNAFSEDCPLPAPGSLKKGSLCLVPSSSRRYGRALVLSVMSDTISAVLMDHGKVVAKVPMEDIFTDLPENTRCFAVMSRPISLHGIEPLDSKYWSKPCIQYLINSLNGNRYLARLRIIRDSTFQTSVELFIRGKNGEISLNRDLVDNRFARFINDVEVPQSPLESNIPVFDKSELLLSKPSVGHSPFSSGPEQDANDDDPLSSVYRERVTVTAEEIQDQLRANLLNNCSAPKIPIPRMMIHHRPTQDGVHQFPVHTPPLSAAAMAAHRGTFESN